MHRLRPTARPAPMLLAWLAVAGCGRGLYTHAPGADASIGNDAPQPDGKNGETPDGASTPQEAGDLVVDGKIQLPVGASTVQRIDWPGGTLVLGPARLIVDRDVFVRPTEVSLTLASADGVVAGYPGAVGPVFHIAKNDVFQRPARFELTLPADETPVPAQRLALGYVDTEARIWIMVANSWYDPATGILSGSVTEFAGARLFGPLMRCSPAEPCTGSQQCGGGVCQ